MTKDGPDFPDRLLVAGRFDGYLFLYVKISDYCEKKAEKTKAEQEIGEWREKIKNAEIEAIRKYQNSPVVDEIVAYLRFKLEGEKPLKIIVTGESVQAISANKTATYSFLAHGLSPLGHFESYFPNGPVIIAPDNIFVVSSRGCCPIKLFADSLNTHMGDQYHVWANGIKATCVELRIKPTRSF